MSARPVIRCAIYTRKSSDEGLGQDFNSLDAQREACAAYVQSQKHEGWQLIPGSYDDGGLSGGSLDRPALQRLLADIDAGRVQMVVVYKIDRLTRSLADFARLVERLEKAGCSFVSVTQAFNTSSSMGRLTLNVLLSFAQFEREVTAERIRDKIAASKRKGMWMGGTLPLGYDRHPDPMRRELVVNEAEAELVRELFRLYDELGCLGALEQAAAARGYRSKRRTFASGRTQGGGPFSRGQLHYLLTNTTYRGLIRHKEALHPGLHPAIVDQDLWDRVQARLQERRVRPRGRRGRLASEAGANVTNATAASQLQQEERSSSSANRDVESAPLTGKLRDETGDRLTPSHSIKAGRRFRYYVSARLLRNPSARGAASPASSQSTAELKGDGRSSTARGWRLPAEVLERSIAAAIADHLTAAADNHTLLAEPTAADADRLAARAAAVGRRLKVTPDMTDDQAGEPGDPPASVLRAVLQEGRIGDGTIQLTLDRAALAAALDVPPAALASPLLTFAMPFSLRRRGVELKLVAGTPAPMPDATMIATLARAHRWAKDLREGRSMVDIAAREGVSEGYLRTRTPLALLSPRVQAAILDGTQPPQLTLEQMVRKPLPLDWSEQERRLGFAD